MGGPYFISRAVFWGLLSPQCQSSTPILSSTVVSFNQESVQFKPTYKKLEKWIQCTDSRSMTFEILPILIHPSIFWLLSRSGWGASNLSIATQNPSPHLPLSVLSWDNKMLHMTPNPKMSSIGVRSGECAGNWSIMYTLSCTRHQFEIIQRYPKMGRLCTQKGWA